MTNIPETVHVPAREARMVPLRKGDIVDVVNTHGGQVVDTWAFPLDAPDEYMSMEHSRILHYRMKNMLLSHCIQLNVIQSEKITKSVGER